MGYRSEKEELGFDNDKPLNEGDCATDPLNKGMGSVVLGRGRDIFFKDNFNHALSAFENCWIFDCRATDTMMIFCPMLNGKK